MSDISYMKYLYSVEWHDKGLNLILIFKQNFKRIWWNLITYFVDERLKFTINCQKWTLKSVIF